MYVLVDGLKTYYEIHGAGETVLLLHGWGANVETMHPISNILKQNYKCILVDLPGFGFSQEPLEAWNSFDYARFIQSFLNELGEGQIHLLGHSHGGRIGLILSALEMVFIKKMVLIDSAGLIPKRKLSYYLKVYTYKAIKKIAPQWIGFSKKRKFLTKIFGSQDYAQTKTDVMRNTLVKVVNDNLKELLPQIKSETLLIWGESDLDTPLYMAHIMNESIPNSGLVILKNAGHYSYVDDYNTFSRVLKHYFSIEEVASC